MFLRSDIPNSKYPSYTNKNTNNNNNNNNNNQNQNHENDAIEMVPQTSDVDR